MARRSRHDPPQNTEAWAIPYGDLITLLLAFFVVMYAVSVVNEGQYRLLSHALMEAFDRTPRVLIQQELDPARQAMLDMDASPVSIEPPAAPPPGIDALAEGGEAEQMIAAMADEVRDALAPLIDEDLVVVRQSRLWLEIDIQASTLFATASSQLSEAARPVLDRVANALRGMPNHVHVEGHTDDRPIQTPLFPSNWELSAARAGAVVSRLQDNGIGADRLVAVGYGEHQPLADNETAFGRRTNRRVSLVVLADPSVREELLERRQRSNEEA